jgi:ferritin-like metal-binding protein YciE
MMSKTEKQINHTIADWLGDIVALESHVEEAMDRQLELKSDNAALSASIKRFHDSVRDSKRRAVSYQEQYGSTAGNPIIKAGSNLLGKAAGMIDKMRNDSVSKALRDDYTAYNHVAMAYTMLHTTAMALGDDGTAAFAEQGLRTYAGMVQELNHIISEAVVQDLRHDEGEQLVNESVVESCRSVIDKIWKATATA